MSQFNVLVLYSLAVVASSLFGGWLPSLFRLTHVKMQVLLSFVGGTMLGVGLLHMLPHAVAEIGSLDRSLQWLLVGLLGMFLLIRTFHFHEHGVAENTGTPADSGDSSRSPHGELPVLPSTATASSQSHRHGCDHDHDHGHHHASIAGGGAGDSHAVGASTIGWLGVAIGLSLHAFLDGVALGAGVMAEAGHEGEGAWAGLGVFLAIVLHKPLDALSITALMEARRWSRPLQQAVNAGFALMCPLGAILFVAAVPYLTSQHEITGIALAIAAGVFLCISLSDLLPEVQFHRHDRLKLSAALLLGVACAYGIYYLEPPHVHGAAAAEGEGAMGTDAHDGHDHGHAHPHAH